MEVEHRLFDLFGIRNIVRGDIPSVHDDPREWPEILQTGRVGQLGPKESVTKIEQGGKRHSQTPQVAPPLSRPLNAQGGTFE